MSLWRTKSLEFLKAEAESGKDKLERALGPVSLVMLGIGAIIGAGLFSITGIAAAEHAGPAIIISFILAAVGCAFAGMCFSELASMIPVSGGVYTYTYATMGEFIAWIMGWLMVIEYSIGAATVSISWSAYIVALFQDFGIQIPHYLIASPWQPTILADGTTVFGIMNLPAAAIVVLISCLLIFGGIKKSAKANAIFVVVKVTVVLVFICLGAFYIDFANYEPFIPANTGTFGEFGWSGIIRAAAIVFFAYIGFDAVSTAAQESKKPQRDLPIGIIGSLIICTLLYIAFALVLLGLVPFQSLNTAAPIAAAVDVTPFKWLIGLIKIAIIAGLSSVILVLLLGQSRIFYVMSKDGLIPKMFSLIHHRYHTPWFSSLFIMVFVALIGAFAPISLAAAMASIGTLLAFAIVCAGVLVLRKTRPDFVRPFKTPLVPLVPILGILSCVALMFSLSLHSWIGLIVWIALGMIFYFAYSFKHSHMNK